MVVGSNVAKVAKVAAKVANQEERVEGNQAGNQEERVVVLERVVVPAKAHRVRVVAKAARQEVKVHRALRQAWRRQ